ncbi:MAG: hypothetical protein JW804_01955 [Sedimentisphaerales bacterium]|nr:hypothetical protein [Sedimentisphaerales bacterium]
MKSEHRHELKTNELAEWLSNFPNWAKENMRMIIYICVVAAAVLGLYGWRAYQKNVVRVNERLRLTQLIRELTRNKINTINGIEKDGIDYSYTLINTSKGFGNFARNTKNKDMAALAYIKQAEALRTELYYRMEPVDKAYLQAQINKAKKSYESAVEKAQDNPSLLALAKYGLGLCEEELGNFEAAREIYRQVSQDKKFAGTDAAASAEYRLKVMDDYREKVAFGRVKPIEPAAKDSLLNPDSANLDLDAILSSPAIESVNAVE